LEDIFLKKKGVFFFFFCFSARFLMN